MPAGVGGVSDVLDEVDLDTVDDFGSDDFHCVHLDLIYGVIAIMLAHQQMCKW